MRNWSEGALRRLREQFAGDARRLEIQLRHGDIIEAKAEAYWKLLTARILEEVVAFNAGVLNASEIRLSYDDIPSCAAGIYVQTAPRNPQNAVQQAAVQIELAAVQIELKVKGHMITFDRKTRPNEESLATGEYGMFCLRVDENENLYVTYKGVSKTIDQVIDLLLTPVVFIGC